MKRQLIAVIVCFVVGGAFCLGDTARAQTYSQDRVNAYVKAQDWQGLYQYAYVETRDNQNSAGDWALLAYAVGQTNQPRAKELAVGDYRQAVQLDAGNAAYRKALISACVADNNIYWADAATNLWLEYQQQQREIAAQAASQENSKESISEQENARARKSGIWK
jgi:hypothetical protein